MRKIGKRIYYVAFFCAIAITLFSLENTMQSDQDKLIIEEIRQSKTREGSNSEKFQKPSIGETSSFNDFSQKFMPLSNQDTTNTDSSHIKIEKKEGIMSATSPKTEKASFPEQEKEKTLEKKEEMQKDEYQEFSSIQSSGLTLANGDSWYFEEYDENGNIVSIVSYNKKKLISKSQFEYNEEGKKIGATLTEPKKIIKLTFDTKGVQIGRTEYKKRKGEAGDISSSQENIYNENGLIQEEKITENGIITRKVYEYNDKKMISETIFENDVKTLFIEYKENTKIVHIFDGENELSVFEEANE